MLDIQLVGTTSGLADLWACDTAALRTEWFTNYGDSQTANVTAYCSAGSNYQWGFSFLLLFFVCIAQCLFAIIMYSLWIDAKWHLQTRTGMYRKATPKGWAAWETADYSSTLSHATNIVRQAEDAYGDVTSWSASKLDRVVWRGRKGMRAPDRSASIADEMAESFDHDES